jgi:hypothetical protein
VIGPTEQFGLSEKVSWRDLGESLVLMNLDSGETFQLADSSAFLFLQFSEGPKSVIEASRALMEEFEVEEAIALADSLQFAEMLRQEGLLERAGP